MDIVANHNSESRRPQQVRMVNGRPRNPISVAAGFWWRPEALPLR